MRFEDGVEQQERRWSVNPTQVLREGI